MTAPGWKTRVQFFAEEDSHGYPKVWNWGGDARALYIDYCMAQQRVEVLETEVKLAEMGQEVGVLVAAYDAWLEANDTEDPDYGY
jgi:hypothetical protein